MRNPLWLSLLLSRAARKGLVAALGLVVLVGGLSCSDDTTPSDVGPDTAVDVGVDGGVDGEVDQGAPGKLTVSVLTVDGIQPGDYTKKPMEGVVVAADLPGDKRVELTTGADGKVTFEEVAWSQGTATVTAYTPGHLMATRAGVTEADGEQTLVMWPFRSQPMTLVSGTAKNMDPAATYLIVSSDIPGGLFEAANTDAFDVAVWQGQPFTLYATTAKWQPSQDPQKPRDLVVDFYGWTKASHPGSDWPVTLDLDFATDQLTPTKVTGTIEIPDTATEVMEGAWRVQCSTFNHGTGLYVGGSTKVTEQSKGTFAMEAEYINVPEATKVYANCSALVSTTYAPHASWVRVDGYLKDGFKVDKFLDTPVLTQPLSSTTPIKRTVPIQWTTNDPQVPPYVLVIGHNRLLWLVEGAPGMTSITLPEPPSTAGEALATVGPTLSARVELRAEYEEQNARWMRWAGSRQFLITAETTKTVTTTGRVIEPQSRQPVGDVKICVKDESTIPCATTDATGYFILSGVPNDKEVILTFEKAGYFTAAMHRAKQQLVTYEIGYYLMARSEQAAWESKLGHTLDSTMGHVYISVTKDGKPAPDASFAITPSAGDGVCYADAFYWPDPSLPATCSAGCGIFSNLPPGNYEVQVTHPGSSSCKPLFGWQGTSSTAAKLVVTADAFSAAAFVCE